MNTTMKMLKITERINVLGLLHHSHIFRKTEKQRRPGDGQRNCPKHVECYSKNKFEKLVHLVGFVIRIYHDARSCECQKRMSNIGRTL
jgi:hypothetical protein